MFHSRRLTFALAAFAALFLALMAYVVVQLWALQDPLLSALAAFAGVVCVAATAATWWVARALDDEGDEVLVQEPPPASIGTRGPARIQALPVAELPPAYLAAVMKGVQANRDAFKARSMLH